ncbi:LCP family protein [Demetria terragena]|uniref:LCP family protein n=1 Tax=Demetria terragena TaxID=63959 RepID=UPI000362267A|nr:LCP family protein [Demetria terragena]
MPQHPATPPQRGQNRPRSETPESRADRRSREIQNAHDVRNAYRFTGISALLPGLGLVFTRRRTLGLIMSLAAVVVLLLAAYSLLSGGVISGAARFLTARGLFILLTLFVVGGLLWVLGIMLTAQETRKDGWSMRTVWWHRGFAALLCLVVATPAAIGANYVLITRDAFSRMSQDRFEGRGGTSNLPAQGGEDPWRNVPRVNMLLIGSDAGAGRFKIRADTVMFVSIDTRSGDTTLVSLPRNLQNVPFPKDNPLHKKYPDGYNCGNECILDAVWTEAGVNERELFPKNEKNPGLNTTREVVEEVVGQPIDYTTVVNLQGFEQLVNAIGGVRVNVPEKLPIGGKVENGVVIPGSIKGYLKPGDRKLNGYDALWYARSRALSSDYDRTRRQRCMVNALVSQASPTTLLQKFPGIMSAAGDNITFDIPQDYLPAFATLAQTMKKGNMRSVNLSPPTINTGNPDYDKIRTLVKKGIETPHDSKAPKSKGSAKPKPKPKAKATTDAAEPSTSTSEKPIDDTRASC